MLQAQNYLELVRNRGERRLELERVYHNLRNPDLFMMAYGRLYANVGAMTEGSDPNDTIDGMSKERIAKVIADLTEGTFRWKPAKRIYIPKANGKMRPLGIPSWTDKLVQEAMRLILEAYFEPRFRDCSHGFRPNRGCHTALIEIKRNWTGTNWFIEGDIKGCFDNIDHEKLVEIVGKYIKDTRFLKLLREMLKAGYREEFRYEQTYSGTPQGGVLSPLLANIYLHELDRYIEKELIPQYTKREWRTTRKMNPVYQNLQNRAYKARKNGEWEVAAELGKELRQTQVKLPSPEYRRLKYVRYADDFLLGFVGTVEEARQIKEGIHSFLETLKLEMSREKTKITHAASERARFLNYEISVARDNFKRTNGRRSVNGQITLRVPQDVKEKWIKKYQKNGKSHHNPRQLANTDYDIIMQYESEIRGLTNYYTLAINVSTLDSVKWASELGLIKTLAGKHKQKGTWVYKKYATQSPDGLKCLQVKIEREGKEPLIAQFGGRPIRRKKFAELEDNVRKYQVWSKRTQLEQRLTANECEICGSKHQVEVHHIHSIKKLNQKYRERGTEMPWWAKHMAESYRKTLVVCHECHDRIHAGQHDGRKLT